MPPHHADAPHEDPQRPSVPETPPTQPIAPPPEEWVVPVAADAQTRRHFLRNTVLATAAASAATGGIAVAAQATGLGPRLLSSVRPATASSSPLPQITCGLCVEDPGFAPTDNLLYGQAYFVWFTLQNLLGGHTYTITLDISSPFSTNLRVFVVHSNIITLFTGGGPALCPRSEPGQGVSQDVLLDTFPFTFTHTPAGSEDFQGLVVTTVDSAPFPFHGTSTSTAFSLTLADSLGNVLCSSGHGVTVTV